MRLAARGGAALILFASAYAYQLPRLRTIWMSPRVAEAVARVGPAPRQPRQHPLYRAEPRLSARHRTCATDARGAAEHLLHDPACALALVGADQREPFLGF